MVSKEDQKIYTPESIPKDFVLIDPDHLTTLEVERLYLHWRLRQNKGLRPITVIHSPEHPETQHMSEKARGKQKAESDEVSLQEEGEEETDDFGKDMDVDPEGNADQGLEEEEEQQSVEKIGPPLGK